MCRKKREKSQKDEKVRSIKERDGEKGISGRDIHNVYLTKVLKSVPMCSVSN